MTDDRLLRVDEVAKLVDVSSSTIRRWVAAVAFPEPIRVTPKVVRWDARAIEAWLTAHKPSAHVTGARG